MKISRRQFIPAALSGMAVIGFSSFINLEEKQRPSAIKAPALKRGDLIAVTSPAGALRDAETAHEFKKKLEDLGFRVKMGESVFSKEGYLAGSDDLRSRELMQLITDKNVNAIVAMKGGYGCARILDKIDYDIIRQHPKIIMGFSDITSLINAIYEKSGLICFHGPVGNSSWGDFTMKYVESVLMEAHSTHYYPGKKAEDQIRTISPGEADGILVGGNLSVFCSMIGTPYLPDPNGKILFLEEVKEEPFRIDRMLAQLKLSGYLQSLKGIVIGKFRDCVAEEKEFEIKTEVLFDTYFKSLGIPVYSGAMIGHISDKYTLPIGANVRMNANKGEMQLLEPAVMK